MQLKVLHNFFLTDEETLLKKININFLPKSVISNLYNFDKKIIILYMIRPLLYFNVNPNKKLRLTNLQKNSIFIKFLTKK